jgi:anti-sigma factor RsiW
VNAETLERLMLDRGLGTLPPDCEALLAAHLEVRPEAGAAWREIERTVDLARAALVEEPPEPVPVFPVERLQRARRSGRLWRTTRGIAAVAAAVLFGFGAHALFFRPPLPSRPQPGAGVVVQGGTERRPDANSGDAGFWSGRRLLDRASSAPSHSTNRLIWDSPVRVPRVGEAT